MSGSSTSSDKCVVVNGGNPVNPSMIENLRREVECFDPAKHPKTHAALLGLLQRYIEEYER